MNKERGQLSCNAAAGQIELKYCLDLTKKLVICGNNRFFFIHTMTCMILKALRWVVTNTLTGGKMQTTFSNNKCHLSEDVYELFLLVSNLRHTIKIPHSLVLNWNATTETKRL